MIGKVIGKDELFLYRFLSLLREGSKDNGNEAGTAQFKIAETADYLLLKSLNKCREFMVKPGGVAYDLDVYKGLMIEAIGDSVSQDDGLFDALKKLFFSRNNSDSYPNYKSLITAVLEDLRSQKQVLKSLGGGL